MRLVSDGCRGLLSRGSSEVRGRSDKSIADLVALRTEYSVLVL